MENNSEKLVNLVKSRLDKNSKYYVEEDNNDIVQVKGTTGLRRVNEIYLPMWCRNLKLSKDFKLKKDDVFVIGRINSNLFFL